MVCPSRSKTFGAVVEDLSSGWKSKEVFSGRGFNEQHFLLEAAEDFPCLSPPPPPPLLLSAAWNQKQICCFFVVWTHWSGSWSVQKDKSKNLVYCVFWAESFCTTHFHLCQFSNRQTLPLTLGPVQVGSGQWHQPPGELVPVKVPDQIWMSEGSSFSILHPSVAVRGQWIQTARSWIRESLLYSGSVCVCSGQVLLFLPLSDRMAIRLVDFPLVGVATGAHSSGPGPGGSCNTPQRLMYADNVTTRNRNNPRCPPTPSPRFFLSSALAIPVRTRGVMET